MPGRMPELPRCRRQQPEYLKGLTFGRQIGARFNVDIAYVKNVCQLWNGVTKMTRDEEFAKQFPNIKFPETSEGRDKTYLKLTKPGKLPEDFFDPQIIKNPRFPLSVVHSATTSPRPVNDWSIISVEHFGTTTARAVIASNSF
jgi:hypothetical protein